MELLIGGDLMGKIKGIDRLIVALDFKTIDEVKDLVEKLGDTVSTYKVGLELFLNTSGEAVDYLLEMKKKVFLDLKFHDIPNTTAMAGRYAENRDVMIYNVHASGGYKMMKEVDRARKEKNSNSLVIAVTVLTSFSENEIQELFGTKLSIKELATKWAKLAKEAGLDGVVCSPLEAKKIKEKCGKDFVTVCPGVRPKWASKDDQERILTPEEAILNNCDYLVIGRPITKNPDPKEGARLILEEINSGLRRLEENLC